MTTLGSLDRAGKANAPRVQMRRLGDVIEYIRGITFKPEEKIAPDAERAVVCMRTKNIQERLDESDLIAVPPTLVRRSELYLREGDLLLSSANSWDLVGKVCKVPALHYKATAGGFISIVRPTDEVHPAYLYRWLSSPETQLRVRRCARQTTNIANLSVEQFEALEMPLPPLAEQSRIADILDKADAIRRKRKEAIALTDELLRSAFLDMFGDPVTNPKGWEVRRFGEVVSKLEAGWSANGEPRPHGDGELGVLKISAVTSGRFLPEEHKAVSRSVIDRPLVTVRRGDLLLSRANTRELVAATCLVDEDRPDLFLPDKLWRIVPSQGATAGYLRFLLGHERLRSQLTKTATGTSGSMLNISMAKLEALPIPVPERRRQEAFDRLVWQTLGSRGIQVAAASSAEALFTALVDAAFSAESAIISGHRPSSAAWDAAATP